MRSKLTFAVLLCFYTFMFSNCSKEYSLDSGYIYTPTPDSSQVSNPDSTQLPKPDSTIIANPDSSQLPHADSIILPLIFLCGQSNMEGNYGEQPIAAEFAQPIGNAYIFHKLSNGSANDGSVEELKYKVNNDWRVPYKYFGPEEGVAYYLTNAGHTIGIVKYAFGGSELSSSGKVNPNGYWQSDGSGSLNHYTILINNFAKPAFEAFKKAGFKPYIAAFAWCQGEADAHDSIAANAYQLNLEQLLNQFKKDMYLQDPFVNDMQVIITRTKDRYAYSGIVRQAQVNVGETYHNAHWIDSDTWPMLPDQTHFTPTAQATLHGKAIADILSDVIK